MNRPVSAPRDIRPVNGQFDYNRVPRGHYERIIWSDHPVRSFWHQKRFDEMSEMMDTDERSVIMDYGCASGSFLGNFKKPYARAVGVDVAAPQIELANEKYGSDRLKFITGDHLSIRSMADRFDYIVASEIIEHVKYDTALEMLRVFHGLLKPGGQLIVSTPNYKSLWPVTEFFVNTFSDVDYDHQHINKLDMPKSAAILRESGFEVEKLVSFFVMAPFTAALSWRLAEKLYRWEKKRLPGAGSIILVRARSHSSATA